MSKKQKQENSTVIGRGGNGEVRVSNGIATKTLQRRNNVEALRRFGAEVEIMRQTMYLGLSNVVQVIEWDTSISTPWYSMREYPGNANDLLSYTRGNVYNTVSLMLPVVQSLRTLSEHPQQIYHRDLKPDNLLYAGTQDNPILMIADFGCAYMKTVEDERLTEDFRAVGATFYRAPEYTHGRVQDVTSAGDIFSIGKLLWFFLNGTKNEVFPYTLWFPAEYDLNRRFPSTPLVTELNLIIAKCVRYAPQMRPPYAELIASLESLLSENIPMPKPDRLALLKFEEESRIEREETRNVTSSLLSIFMKELFSSLDQLAQDYDGIDIIQRLCRNRRPDLPLGDLVIHPVDQGSDAPVWSFHSKDLSIHARIFPTRNSSHASGLKTPPDAPPIRLTLRTTSRTGESLEFSIVLHVTGGQLLQTLFVPEGGDRQPHPFQKGAIYALFVSAINHLAK